MATIRLIPSHYDRSSTNRVTVTNETNMYYNTDHTANYAEIRGRNSTNSTYYAFINGFNFNDVPSDAIVNSFTVKIRCYRNTYQQTGSSYNLRLSSTASNNDVISNTTTSTAIGTTASVITIPTGNLTWSQLSGYGSDFSIEIPLMPSSSQYPYVYVYGAEIEVDYSLPVYHNVSVSVETDKVTSVSPSTTQSVAEGNDYELHIISSSIPGEDFKVEDNTVEVTNQLVAHYPSSSGNANTVLGTYSLVSGSFNGSGASYFQGLVGKGVNNTQTTSNYYSGGSGTITVFTYKLEFSNIPSNATITNLYVQVNGHAESTSNSSEYMCAQIMTGSTALSDELNFKSIGTSNSTQTINAITLPTVSQLNDLKLQCRLGYYGGAINGATAYIEYEIPSSSSDPDYYIYTIENVTTNHTIVISDSIIEIPEEDPQKTYYPITISGINCTTTPGKGTNRIEAGTSQTITIYPTESQVTLITDNGVDVSSQLVQHGGTIPTPTVSTASGASYGFTLNSGTGYYVSQNTGVDKSAAVCVVNFNLPVRCLVTINYINYAEATYDFGIFGNIDVPLTNNYKPASGSMPDSDYKLACNTSTYNTANVQTITYEIPSGEHQIYIKYSKDDASSENNDSLQWKIASIEPLEINNYYTYTLSNINQEHSLIFIFGNVTYYFVNSSVNGEALLYPNGSMVALPGDNYTLTIVPKVDNGTLMLTDNNVDRTSQIQTKTITITKEGQQVTVTNYIYSLSNVQATHNISVTYSTQSTYEIRQVNNSLDLTISPTGTQEVDAGDNYTVSITTSKPGTITVTDSISGTTTYNVSLSDVSGGSKTITHTLTNIRASKTLTFDFTELTKYNVTASENSTYLSIPSGYASQSVYSGQSCDVKFTSTTPGTITVSDNGTNTNYTVSSPNQTITHTIASVIAAHTVSATFTIASYNITTSLKSGSSSVTINPASSSVNYNGSYTVTLTPSVPGTLTISEGSTTLQTWVIPIDDLSSKTYTVNNITATHTYTVNLTELTKYTVSASENSTYLSIPSGYTSQSIYSGQSCEVKFTSTTPGTITVTDNGNNTNYPVTANGTITHTITSVTAAHTVTATFTIASYQVSASVTSGSASVTLNPSTAQSINHGSAYTLNITPSVPGTITIKEGNTTVQTYTINVGDLSAKTFTVNNITAAHTYTITLTELTKYNVTASENSSYLSIPSGYASQSIYSGQSCDVKFTSTTPGTITVSDNGTITHTISSVTAAHTVSATFTIASYAITTSLKSGSKTVTINPVSSNVNHNDSYTVTLTPSVPGTLTISEGSTTLQTWTIPVGDLSAKTYTVNNITAAHTYTVNLTELTKYTVSASENSEYLSIPSGYTSQSIYSGQSCDVKFTATIPGTLTVTDNGNNSSYQVTSSNQTITHTINSVTTNHTVTATFSTVTYNISASLESGSASVTLNPSGTQSIGHGNTYTLSMTPSVPGTLTISEGSTTLETWVIPVGNLAAKTYTVENITSAHTYVVNLTELTKYNVTAAESSEYLSIPSGYASQSIYSGQNCDVKFTSTTPGTITVSDNGTDTNYIVSANQTITHTIESINAAHTITATFTIATYLVSASSSVTGVTLTPTSQTINHGESASITIKSTNPGTVIITDNGTDSSYTINTTNGTATHTISSVTAAHTITVKSFTLAKYTVTATNGSNVTSVSPASQSLDYGSNVSLNVTSTVPGTLTIKETNLPYDAEIEYLQSTGTQWIDTGIVPDATTGFEAEVVCSNNTDSYFIGLRNNSSNTRWGAGHSSGGFYWCYGSYQTSGRLTGLSANIKLNYLNDKKFIATNGSTVADVSLPSLSFTPAYNIRLFGSAGTVASYSKWSGKIYYVKITQGSELVMDLIPVRVGQVGYMYDKVSGRLFGNSGTGNFTLGPDVDTSGTLTIYEQEISPSEAGTSITCSNIYTNLSTNHSVIASVAGLGQHTVTVTNNSPSILSYTPSSPISIYDGETLTINFVPTQPGTLTVTDSVSSSNNQTYTITSSDVNVAKVYTIANVTADRTITANLTIASYTVIASSVTGVTLTPASQTITHGGNATITIESTNPGTVVITDNGTDSSYIINEANGTVTHTISSVTAAHTVTVKSFTIAKYTVTATTGTNVTSVSPASQSLDYGSNVSLNVTPTVPGTLNIKETNLPYDAEIEYIQNTGSSCIDTNYIPTGANIKIQGKFTPISYSGSYAAWFAAYSGENNESYRIIRYNTDNTKIYFTCGGKANGSGSKSIGSLNTIYEFELVRNSLTLNNSTQTYTPSNGETNTSKLILFSTESKSIFTRGKLYYFKVYDNNVIIMDLIPVRVGSVGYMYDKVSKQLFGNDGTGSFTLGPDVDTSGTLTIYSTDIAVGQQGISKTCSNIYTNLSVNHSVIASVDELTKYNVSVTNNSSTYLTVTPSSTQSIYSGQNATIQIKTTKAGTVSITDNVTGNTSYLEYSNSELNTNKSFTLENVTSAHTLTISLSAQTYPVSVSTESEYITITSQTPVNIADGSNYQVTANASIPGTVTLKEGNTTINSANVTSPDGTYSYNVTNITSQRIFTLLFTPTNYTVSASVSSGSDVTIISGASYSGIYGTQYTLTFRSGSIGTISVNDSGTVTTYTIGPDEVNQTQTYQKTVTDNSTITLSNSIDTYDITCTIASGSTTYLKYVDNGTDKTSLSKTVNAGSNYVLNIKSTHPGTLSLTINGDTSNVTLSDSYTYPYTYAYEINNILDDVTISSSFAVLTFDIQDNGSTIDNIVYGQSYTYTFTPTVAGTYKLYDNDSLIETYNITAAQVGIAKSYTINRVTSPHNFSVSSTVQTYSINVTNNAQTYISNINVSNRNPEYNGSSVITIYPRLKGTINITDNNGTPTTISTTGVQKEYTLQNITTDHTIVIIFTPGTYVATLTNNIPSTYNYTLSKNSGNYNVTGCETFSFTLSANQTESSKTTMNGKVIVARTIGGSTIRKIYSIIKDTPFSATYEVGDVVSDMTITLTFEETQEAPANGDRFLKPFNTDNDAQAYVANNNPNPFIYYDRLTHYVNYTSHLGNMRMTTQIYRGGNGHKLFERD